MDETYNWDDLRLFLAVARSGGLAAAASATALSPPTLGRRMTDLERSLGLTLFARHRLGYDLTAAGRDLVAHAEAFEQQALALERWRSSRESLPVVRIAAGDWTARFLTEHAAALVEPTEGPFLEVLVGVSDSDLNRREANLGIRNRRPDRPGLAGRRLGPVEFAVFATADLLARHPGADSDRRFDLPDWVVFSPTDGVTPSAAWLQRKLRATPALRCSSPRLVLDAALAGAGLCVLPCFVGDAEAGLERASDPITDLAHEQWLVSHDDDRHDPRIRSVITRITPPVSAAP